MTDAECTIVFAGGGSGGHISPGLAIAERLREVAPRAQSIFACSTRPIDAQMLGEAGESYVPITAAPMSLNPVRWPAFYSAFSKGRAQAEAMMRDRQVDLVVALGGFVTGPVVAAAERLKIPVLLVNLDAAPGRANRWIAKRSARVVSSAPTPSIPQFAEKLVGFPLRMIAVANRSPAECRRELGLDPETPTLLVTGASQGATSLNDLLTHLAAVNAGLFHHWQILHLAGAGQDEQVRRAYSAAGVAAVVHPFLHQIGLAWGAADLAISRAGANSVAEAAANGVPTIFLPYPYHRDLHQKWNAQPVVDSGGAFLMLDKIDAAKNAEAMVPLLRGLLSDSAKRGIMRAAILRHATPDAAREIAAMAVEMAAKRS